MEWTPDPRCCSIRLAGRCPEEAPTMSLTYRRVNPLDHPASIKRLFVEQGRPEFPAWFDRAYPVLVASGGSSWVAIDSAGNVQLHIATFPVQMRCRGTTIKAVLFSNLIASADHRNFLPAAGLLRQAVEGMKRDGRDVLYAPPGNDGALAVVRAAGFTVVGASARFVQLTGDRRRLLDWAAGGVLAGRGIISRRRIRVERCDAREAVGQLAAIAAPRETALEIVRAPELYEMRLAGFGGLEDVGFLIHDPNETVVGAALLRVDRESRMARLVSIRCSSFGLVAAALRQLGRQARSLGMVRVSANVLVESARARALVKAGFRERPETTPLTAQAFTDAGREALALIGTSDIEDIDLD